MLLTEPPQNPLARIPMASYHSKAQVNGSATTFGSMTPQSTRYGSGSTTGSSRSDYTSGSQQALYPPMPQTISPPPTDIPQPNQNIMNMRAGANSSLYQICLNLRKRLNDVPGFQEHIAEMEEEELETNDSTDPVTSMWNCLRRGYPLLTVYNAFQPRLLLEVDSSTVSDSKVGKKATFMFLEACMKELKFPSSDLFLITDLYGEDTTGFVKVTKVLNRVLDLLQRKGLLRQRAQSVVDSEGKGKTPVTIRERVIDEIVSTERDYVQHLENLQQFKNEVEASGAIPGDAVHDIFLNLNALLDFQRRFLIRVEQQNSLPEASQNWGKLFFFYQEQFRVYEPFIANQTKCQNVLETQWDKLRLAPVTSNLQDLLETPSTLLGFLLKPFQRLTKYPLLLTELRDKGGLDEERRKDLADGRAAAESILARANDALHKEERLKAVAELQVRVEDWKGHKIDHFGDLLLYGNYTVLKGEGAKEVEREYKVYLFERILLCCKEINPNKPKNKMLGNSKPMIDKKGKLKLQLKGRIFMQNVTDVVTVSKAGISSHTIQIFWRGDPGVESFVIRFASEEAMIKWRDTVQGQKTILGEAARGSREHATSATEFSWTREHAPSINPYREADIDEEDDSQTPQVIGGKSSFSVSRETSNSSLRSVPGQPPGSRVPPQKYPMAGDGYRGYGPPLSVNTNVPHGASSPGDFNGPSYFSPAMSEASPISQRTSSQTGMYGFSRQQIPPPGSTYERDKHRTAPAMARAPSREGVHQQIRGTLPAMAVSQHASQQLASAQSRLRSASTPDIPNPPGSRRQPNGLYPSPQEDVPVPPLPTALRAPLNRSQTSSPVDGQLPVRKAGQASSMHYPPYDGINRRHPNGTPLTLVHSNPTPTSDPAIPLPQQLKVKIHFHPDPSHVTIVVAINIKHRMLIDRIDSKMVKISSASISRGGAKLRYKDAEGDLLTINSDEAVQLAIDDWRDSHSERLLEGITDDFELYWEERAFTRD